MLMTPGGDAPASLPASLAAAVAVSEGDSLGEGRASAKPMSLRHAMSPVTGEEIVIVIVVGSPFFQESIMK